jgi:cysteine desulfurase
VLHALYPGSRRGAIRFSFSKFNTKEEIDFAVDKVGELGKVGVQRLENTRISS